MLEKIKYIFTDFSDNFKNDFISTLKKSIAFLMAGIIASFFINSSESGIAELVCAVGFIAFGIIWAKRVYSALSTLILIPQNIVIKAFLFLAVSIVCMILGYLYFAWGIIKLLLIAGKNVASKSKNSGDFQ